MYKKFILNPTKTDFTVIDCTIKHVTIVIYDRKKVMRLVPESGRLRLIGEDQRQTEGYGHTHQHHLGPML